MEASAKFWEFIKITSICATNDVMLSLFLDGNLFSHWKEHHKCDNGVCIYLMNLKTRKTFVAIWKFVLYSMTIVRKSTTKFPFFLFDRYPPLMRSDTHIPVCFNAVMFSVYLCVSGNNTLKVNIYLLLQVSFQKICDKCDNILVCIGTNPVKFVILVLTNT